MTKQQYNTKKAKEIKEILSLLPLVERCYSESFDSETKHEIYESLFLQSLNSLILYKSYLIKQQLKDLLK